MQNSLITRALAIALTLAALASCGDNLKPSLSVTPDTIHVAIGGKAQITASLGGYIPPEGLEKTGMTWVIDDPAMVQLDPNATGALITGLQVGTTTATVTCVGSSVDVTIVVDAGNSQLVAVDIEPDPLTIPLGLTAHVGAYATYADGTHVNVSNTATWTVDDAGILSIQGAAGGMVTGLAVGATTLHAAFDGMTADDPVDVTAASLVSLAITPPALTLATGLSGQLAAIGTFSDHTVVDLTTSVAWSSAAPTTASVSAAGRVTGVAPGATTVTAALGAITATAAITVTNATVVGLAISPPAPILPAGRDLQLHAYALLSDGTTADVTSSVAWLSHGPAIATVSSTGDLTGVAVGVTSVSATLGAATASAPVTVTAAELESITISPMTLTLAVGTTGQLTAYATFSDGSKLDVTSQVAWTSANSVTATVSNVIDPGLVAAHAVGTTTVTASIGAISGTATVNVTSATLVSLTITAPTTTLPLGTTEQLTATGTFSDGTTQNLTTQVLWTSSAPLTVAVSDAPGSQGVAGAISLGAATITAQLGAVSASIVINATAATCTGIVISPATLALAAGTSGQLTATAEFTDGTTLDVTTTAVWTTTNAVIASVVGGDVTAGAPGTATVSASYAGHSGSATVTVGTATLVSIQITPPVLTLPLGTSFGLTATGLYSDGTHQDLTNAATWASTDAAVATVSNAPPAGVVKGVGLGTATVSATVGAASASVLVTVGPAMLLSIAISPASLTLPIGTSAQLSATGTFSNGTTADLTGQVTWTSSNPLVASVGTVAPFAGLVTANTLGNAHIIATFGAVSASITVSTTTAVVMSIDVEPSTAAIPVGVLVPFTAIAKLSDGTKLDVTPVVAWASTAPAIASVSNAPLAHGVVSANAVGAATITATLTGVTGSAAVTVTDAVMTGLAVAPLIATVPLGTTFPMTAIAFYTDGSHADVTAQVTWTSTLPLVASISNAAGSHGQVTGNLLGAAAVGAQLGGFVAGAQVVVSPAILAALQLSPPALTLAAGLSGQLTATGVYSDGTKVDLTGVMVCQSSAPAVATVASGPLVHGLVTAASAGAATVTCAVGTVTATSTITVTAALLETITLSPPLPIVQAGVTLQLHATGTFSDGTVQDLTSQATWSSGDPAVAAVSNAAATVGRVTGVAPGTSIITAQLGPRAGQVTVTVSPAILTGIDILPLGLILPKGLSTPLVAVGIYSDGSTADLTASVTWSTTDTGVVTVSNVIGIVGLATAAGVGTATVKAQIGPITATLQIEVTAAILQSITVTLPELAIPAGLAIPAVAVGVFSDGSLLDITTDATWLSTDTSIAAVSNLAGLAGLITAKAPGTTTIEVQVLGVTATVTLTVTSAELLSIAISGTLSLLESAGPDALTALGTYTDGTVQDVTSLVSWSSTNPLVALVSNLLGSAGVVTPLGLGSVTIKAVLGGVAGSAPMTIKLF